MNHRKHKVLGNYCWDCKISTKAGIPNWPSGPSESDIFYDIRNQTPKGLEVDDNPYKNLEEVVWTDGTRDMRNTAGGSEREDCIQCSNSNCKIPVHSEKYRIITSKLASNWDKANPVIGSGSFDSDCRCSHAS
jgi:hypothetical protein